LDVEDAGVIHLSYDSGLIAEVATSNAFTSSLDSVEIYGTRGTALLRGVDMASREVSDAPYLRYCLHKSDEYKWEESSAISRFVTGVFHQNGPDEFVSVLS